MEKGSMSNILFEANRACQACELRKFCKGPVPAEGPMEAEVAFIGEAPGANEDKTGLPFRGQAGQYFDQLLRSINVDRSKVWVTNTTKCRPTGNRTPTPEEVEICASRWLDVELAMVKPKVIVPMGEPAIRHFLGEGTVYERHGIPISFRDEASQCVSKAGMEGETSRRGMDGAVCGVPDGEGSIILPVYHPAAGLHNPPLMKDIQADFRVLQEVLTPGWEPVRDEFPNPHYYEGHGVRSKVPLALDSEWVDNKLWSVQVSGTPGTGTFIVAREEDKFQTDELIIVHNYMADAEFVDLPEQTRDAMLMAYLLGLPQGLKDLAKRLCGMEMKSYSEMVQPYGKEKAMDYLERAAKGSREQTQESDYFEYSPWPDPPILEDFTWNKKTNTLGTKQKTPQHISKKIARILADVRGGKVNKDGPVDPYARWNQIDSRERQCVEEVLGFMPDGNLSDTPKGDAVFYSCRDADATLRVHNVLWPRILENGMQMVFQVDMDTLPIALEMQRNGIKIDVAGLQGLSEMFSEMMVEKAEEIIQTANAAIQDRSDIVEGGWRFNPNSDNELRKLFFTELGFKPTKFTKTGLPSVAGEELAKIDHILVKMVEEYRHVQHLKDSFCDTLPTKADGNGRVHPTIRTTRTATGRWSMADPNCQQIPTRTEMGRKIREQFVAGEGQSLVAIDYSQIELRVAAHLSQCKSMMEAFNEGKDIHSETASRLFGVQEPTEKQRYAAKTLNFGVIYGISDVGFQAQMEVEGLGWTVAECGAFIKESNSLRPELWVWQEETKAFARRNGYVMDAIGRRRLVPEILSPVKWIRASGEREAINQPVQATAQAILKMAMAKIWKGMPWWFSGRDAVWLLQIHDELLWEVGRPFVSRFIEEMIPIMENVVDLSVPVIAEAKTGLNWGEMVKWTG